MNHLLAAADQSGASPAGVILLILIWGSMFAFYWMPSIIAAFRWRDLPNPGGVLIINFFAWFFIFPWVIALVMAVRSKPQPVVIAPSPYGFQLQPQQQPFPQPIARQQQPPPQIP